MMRRNVYSTCDIQLPNGKKYVAVHLLTLETLYFVVEVKSKVSELFTEICKYLGLLESELFGLSVVDTDASFVYLDPSVKLCKYTPKQWKTANSGVDNTGKSLFGVYLRVQFYVDSYLFISDKVAKLLYYLQLRENVVNYGQTLCEERAFLLASYALQADFGNFNPEKHLQHHRQYFNPHHYFPSWVIERLGLDYITRHLPYLHRDHKGMHKLEAQSMYIKEASDSTSPHNLHMYKLKSKKLTNGEVWFGICPNGVEIYNEEKRVTTDENTFMHKVPLSVFKWPDIGKLYFEKKKFEIHSVGFPVRKFSYQTNSEDMARHLLWLCRVTHQFQMIVQSKVKEVKRREQELCRKKFRESYIYSDSFELPIIGRMKRPDSVDSPPSVGDGTQRVSVISNASSNTTSGIVSDKVQSLEDSDRDDIDIEIMINSPQVASLESLALSEPTGTTCGATSSTSIIERAHHSMSIGNINFNNANCNCPNAKKLSDTEVPSSANSTKSTSSEQSTTTVKSVVPSNSSVPTTQIITIISNNHKDHQLKTTDRNSSSPLPSNGIPITSLSSSLSEQRLQRPTNSCAKAILYVQDHSDMPIGVSHSSKLPERSESMNHIYENIPYFSQFRGNRTPNDDEPPPLPTSAPPQRTATRIGVSSLTRVHNKPQFTVFKQNAHITGAHLNPSVAGSEPNLYNNSKLWSPAKPNLTQSNYLSLPINGSSASNAQEWGVNLSNFAHSSTDNLPKQEYNSRSQLMLDFCKESRAYSDPPYHYVVAPPLKSPSPPTLVNMSNAQRVVECSPQSFHQSLNDIAITSPQPLLRLVGSDVNINNINTLPIFIPPPPDYANSSPSIKQNGKSHFSHASSSHKENGILKNKVSMNGKIKSSGQLDEEMNGSITDLNQLRQKSRDLDLPLITALFNDRSLMMLPKTVPTCSRQRHLGNARDIRRFSCSYEGEINSGIINNSKVLKSSINKLNNDILLPTITINNRPTSWHLEFPNTNIWDHLPQHKQHDQNKFKSATAEFIDRLWAEHQLTT